MYKPRTPPDIQKFSKNQFDIPEPQSTLGMDLNVFAPCIFAGLAAGGVSGEKEVLQSCPPPSISPVCFNDEHDDGVEGVGGCFAGLQKTNEGDKHQHLDDVDVGSNPKNCETEDDSFAPTDLVSSNDKFSRKKKEVLARKQNKMEKEELKRKDRARKGDKQHKTQKRFDLVAEQLDEQFPPLPRIIHSEDEVDYDSGDREENKEKQQVPAKEGLSTRSFQQRGPFSKAGPSSSINRPLTRSQKQKFFY
ncbi:hypothetical protein FXO38_11896 [Capsicum annuum]|nr:hypothetical protein FXO37_16129 [Capsicum annuum]KAF3661066.1 hypothetical protein FXO38_11896 [Capsicum annuum]